MELTFIFAHGRGLVDRLLPAHEIQNAATINSAVLGGGQSELDRAVVPRIEEKPPFVRDMIKLYEIRLQPTMRDFLYTVAGIAVVSRAKASEFAARCNINI